MKSLRKNIVEVLRLIDIKLLINNGFLSEREGNSKKARE